MTLKNEQQLGFSALFWGNLRITSLVVKGLPQHVHPLTERHKWETKATSQPQFVITRIFAQIKLSFRGFLIIRQLCYLSAEGGVSSHFMLEWSYFLLFQ